MDNTEVRAACSAHFSDTRPAGQLASRDEVGGWHLHQRQLHFRRFLGQQGTKPQSVCNLRVIRHVIPHIFRSLVLLIFRSWADVVWLVPA